MTTDAQQVTFGFCTSGTNGITMSIGACFSEVHSGFPAGKTLMNDSNGNGLLFINLAPHVRDSGRKQFYSLTCCKQ